MAWASPRIWEENSDEGHSGAAVHPKGGEYSRTEGGGEELCNLFKSQSGWKIQDRAMEGKASVLSGVRQGLHVDSVQQQVTGEQPLGVCRGDGETLTSAEGTLWRKRSVQRTQQRGYERRDRERAAHQEETPLGGR